MSEHRLVDRLGDVGDTVLDPHADAPEAARHVRNDDGNERHDDERKRRQSPIQIEHEADVEDDRRSEEHTSELQSLMRISYAVFCLKKKKNKNIQTNTRLS